MSTFANSEDPDEKCSTLFAKVKKDLQTKEYNIFFKHYNMTPLDMYNRLSQVYCIKPEGSIHKNTKVNRYTEQNF